MGLRVLKGFSLRVSGFHRGVVVGLDKSFLNIIRARKYQARHRCQGRKLLSLLVLGVISATPLGTASQWSQLEVLWNS